MRTYNSLIKCLCLALLLSCTSGSVIVTGKVRPPIDPGEVKIYIDPPLKYETIGIVEASSDVEFSAQTAQDRAIHELKTQAAKIGANGVILFYVENKSNQSGFVSGNTLYYSTSEKKCVNGKAIFVIQE